jgi:RNA polymerase sigma-70 factor (ECF subfamily)
MGAGTDPVEGRIAAALDGGDLAGAATAALRAYGPGILGYLAAVLRDDDAAAEAFSAFGEDLWKGIGGFRRASTMKTWAYRVAWRAALRVLGSPRRRRERRLRTSEVSSLVAEIWTTASAQRLDRQADELRALRERLDPEEQTLLILRFDRALSWNQVAEVLSLDGAPVDPAALRKRFERLKTRMRELRTEQGARRR